MDCQIKIIFWSCFNRLTFCLHHVLNLKYCSLTFSASGKFKMFEINLLEHCTTRIKRKRLLFWTYIRTNNIPATPAYRVYISQVIRYSRTCGSYHDFRDRGLLLTRKLLNQGFQLVKLKSSLRKFYGHHHDLVNCYGVSVWQKTKYMFCLLYSHSGPFLVHDR